MNTFWIKNTWGKYSLSSNGTVRIKRPHRCQLKGVPLLPRAGGVLASVFHTQHLLPGMGSE